MRWAIHCQPRECKSNTSSDIADTQGGTSADGIKMEYFFAVVAVCGILVITTIILCCIIRNKGKQQQQQQTAHTSASRETTAAQEGNGQGAVYDYIDLQEFHNYLANAASEKSLADCHVDTNAMKAATSHTSINSIYGCGNDVENRNTDNGTIRRFSHTSENSLYGCHS
ncbi:uncharacterized protein [Macrobrachium rosenbergii]|uniref:uncharacterized protein isoform X2 n=1 Tax=Macrobrachium rosenbergii TaxID=79674 RepID=UPI0034D46D2D